MTQRYQELVQEDLNVGTQAVWITAPHGGEVRSTQIGLHSVARGQKAWTATWAPGAIAAGSYATTTIPVTDALVGDFVMASHDKILTNDLRILGNVMESGTAQVVLHNPTASSITVPSGTVGVLVFPAIERDVTPAPPDPPTAFFTWSVDVFPDTSVDFTDASTAVAPATIVSWAWDFGDGVGTSTLQNPTYDYEAGGDWTVTLTVTDSNGLTDDYSELVSTPIAP
jgi:PKD repeat protein